MKHAIVCDDHFVSAVGLKALLTEYFSGVRVSITSSGVQALELGFNDPPDLAIIDLGLPDMSGIDVVRALRERLSQCQIIVMTGSTDARLLREAVGLKPNAVLLKHRSEQNLHDAFAARAPYVDPVIQKILDMPSEARLTARELEVLKLMSQGLTSRRIADQMKCAVTTVKTYRSRIMTKTNSKNSSEMMAWFLKGNSDDCLSSLVDG